MGSVAIVALLAVFLVLTEISGSSAGSQAVIQLGSKSSVAKYLGQFDGKAKASMLGTQSIMGWICVKIPFKGRISDVGLIAFSEPVAQAGGSAALEPCIIQRLTEARFPVCNPVSCYENGTWSLLLLKWQARHVATMGMWIFSASDSKSTSASLETWKRKIDDSNFLTVDIVVGR